MAKLNDKKAAKKIKRIGLVGAEMTAEGLKYNGILMQPVVEQCEGCERMIPIEDNKYCPSYPEPALKWARGVCNFATHVRATVDATGNVKINPLKASKRAARGR